MPTQYLRSSATAKPTLSPLQPPNRLPHLGTLCDCLLQKALYCGGVVKLYRDGEGVRAEFELGLRRALLVGQTYPILRGGHQHRPIVARLSEQAPRLT